MEAFLPIAIKPVYEPSSFAPTAKGPGFFEHLLDHFIPHSRNNYQPHIFSQRLTSLLSLLLVCAKVCTLAFLTFGPVLPAYSSAITGSNIISLTNASREEYGLKDVTENNALDQAAQTKANDMLAKGYFAHNTPDGKTPWDFITAAGYNYITAGENLAVNFTEAENVETAWMNSPGHRANILNGSFEEIGIGISEGQYQGHTAIFVVQMFGTQADEKITLSDTPTPVLTQAVPTPQKATQNLASKQKTAVIPAPKATPEAAPVAVLPNLLPTPVDTSSLQISNQDVQISGNNVTISAQVLGDPVKVLANFGQQAIMLSPEQNNIWQGSASLADLSSAGASLNIKAFSITGQSTVEPLADFASSTPTNYNFAPEVKSAHVTIGSFSFDPNVFEQKFYLLFIAAMLTSLILAIAVKRHVQHVSVVANGSFVVILACLLWMAG